MAFFDLHPVLASFGTAVLLFALGLSGLTPSVRGGLEIVWWFLSLYFVLLGISAAHYKLGASTIPLGASVLAIGIVVIASYGFRKYRGRRIDKSLK